jgi:hypothetical protein
LLGIKKVAGLWKFQAPKYKSQININNQISKFKTDRMKARHPIIN